MNFDETCWHSRRELLVRHQRDALITGTDERHRWLWRLPTQITDWGLLIAITDHRDLGHRRFDGAEIIRSQFNVDCAIVLIQPFKFATTRNRHDPRLLRQQPGQRNLRRGCIVLCTNTLEHSAFITVLSKQPFALLGVSDR
jgi:hypothetical protein